MGKVQKWKKVQVLPRSARPNIAAEQMISRSRRQGCYCCTALHNELASLTQP